MSFEAYGRESKSNRLWNEKEKYIFTLPRIHKHRHVLPVERLDLELPSDPIQTNNCPHRSLLHGPIGAFRVEEEYSALCRTAGCRSQLI